MIVFDIEKHFILVAFVKQGIIKVGSTVIVQTEHIGSIKVRVHRVADSVVPDYVLVLQGSDPEMLCQCFEPLIVLLEVIGWSLVDCLHEECLDDWTHIVDPVLPQPADSCHAIRLFLKVSND